MYARFLPDWLSWEGFINIGSISKVDLNLYEWLVTAESFSNRFILRSIEDLPQSETGMSLGSLHQRTQHGVEEGLWVPASQKCRERTRTRYCVAFEHRRALTYQMHFPG